MNDFLNRMMPTAWFMLLLAILSMLGLVINLARLRRPRTIPSSGYRTGCLVGVIFGIAVGICIGLVMELYLQAHPSLFR